MSTKPQGENKERLRRKCLRVCYFGTYRVSYNRNQILIAGLRANGAEVYACHAKLWQSIEDRINIASGGWLNPIFWWRLVKTYWHLLQQFRKIPAYDMMIVGYPGHFDVYLAWLITRIQHKPLVWDVLNSLYLISKERGITQRHPITGQLIKFLEKIACNLPEMLLLDTQVFIDWFTNTHKLHHDRFRIVEIGADNRIFQRKQPHPQAPGDAFTVLYYGTYIPNHGVSYIAEAAHRLSDEPGIQFLFVGEGPERAQVYQWVQDVGLSNISFIDWLPREDLIDRMGHADLVLGVFGATEQVNLTNNNKILEGFALEKPVLSARSPALYPEIIHGENIYLVSQASPQEISQAILTLKNQPQLRMKIAQNGYQLFHKTFSVEAIGARLVDHLNEFAG
jgi:glycosyltransferase involved in cell wall biosynthesis